MLIKLCSVVQDILLTAQSNTDASAVKRPVCGPLDLFHLKPNQVTHPDRCFDFSCFHPCRRFKLCVYPPSSFEVVYVCLIDSADPYFDSQQLCLL